MNAVFEGKKLSKSVGLGIIHRSGMQTTQYSTALSSSKAQVPYDPLNALWQHQKAKKYNLQSWNNAVYREKNGQPKRNF